MEKKVKEKKGFSFMSLFKLIFSLSFLVVTILWTLYVISFIGFYNQGWDWASSIPGITDINNMLQDFVASNKNETLKMGGVASMFVGVDIVLVYTTVFYPIQKIPFIGKLLRWITGIIPTLGVILIIIGAILIWAI